MSFSVKTQVQNFSRFCSGGDVLHKSGLRWSSTKSAAARSWTDGRMNSSSTRRSRGSESNMNDASKVMSVAAIVAWQRSSKQTNKQTKTHPGTKISKTPHFRIIRLNSSFTPDAKVLSLLSPPIHHPPDSSRYFTSCPSLLPWHRLQQERNDTRSYSLCLVTKPTRFPVTHGRCQATKPAWGLTGLHRTNVVG